MNKKFKILIVLIIILLIFITLFIIGRFDRAKPPTESSIEPPAENIPHITSNERINRIIFNSHLAKVLREEHGDLVLNENSLINLVHVIKEESGYKIFCELGPAYETANLNKFYPEELVSMGQIKNCTLETAKAIDEAIKSFEVDCRAPITSPYSPPAVLSSLVDYYLVALEVEEYIVTREWIDKTKGTRCFEPLENLEGERIAIRFIMGIVDLKSNRIYY